MNHIRTYHYYWHIFFFSLLVCMAEFTKAADRDVLERVIYLAKSKGTVYTLLGRTAHYSSGCLRNYRSAGYQSAHCGESYFDQSVAGAMSGCYHF